MEFQGHTVLQVQFASSSCLLLEYCIQCSVQVFAGLLQDPYKNQVMQLLFMLCCWHGFAKLCLHTDETLNILGQVTKDLTNHLCRFVSDTCPSFPTKELRCEANACKRHQECQNMKAVGTGQFQNGSTHQSKGLNLQIYVQAPCSRWLSHT